MDSKPFLLVSLLVTALCVNCTRQSQSVHQTNDNCTLKLELFADSRTTDTKFNQVSHFTLKLNNASLVPKLVISNPVMSTKSGLDDGLEVVIVKNGKRYIVLHEGREPRTKMRWLWKGKPAFYFYEINWKYLVPVDAALVHKNEYKNRQFGPYEVQIVLIRKGESILHSNIITIEYLDD